MQSDLATFPTTPIVKRMSAPSLIVKQDNPEYVINRFSQKYDSYQGLLHRRRLSSTGEGSGDSSTTTSGSSYGEREDGSEDRGDNDEMYKDDKVEETKTLVGELTDAERQQVETSFKGLKTQVYVSSSLCNLYMKTPADVDWKLKFTGIPLVILDNGDAKARDKRGIQILLAERGTCFMLWRDTIDNLSSYKVSTKAFHTMCYSGDHTLQIGFSFDMAQAAHDMWTHIEQLVSCPENISLSVPGKKKKRKEKKQTKPPPLPPKSHISQPCCFQHVTSIEKNDKEKYFSFREYMPHLRSFTANSEQF